MPELFLVKQRQNWSDYFLCQREAIKSKHSASIRNFKKTQTKPEIWVWLDNHKVGLLLPLKYFKDKKSHVSAGSGKARPCIYL